MQHMHMMPVMPHDDEDMDKRKTPSSWDPHDDLLLRHLKETLKLGWKEIASHFPNRTPNACQFRWRRLISGTLRTPQPLLTLIPLDQQQQQGQPQGQPGQMQQAQQMQPQMQQRPPGSLQQGPPHGQMPPQGHPQHPQQQQAAPHQHAPQQHAAPPPHHLPPQQYPYPYGYPMGYGPQGGLQGVPRPPQQQPPQTQPHPQAQQHVTSQPQQAPLPQQSAPQLHMPPHMQQQQQQPPAPTYRPTLSPEVPQMQQPTVSTPQEVVAPPAPTSAGSASAPMLQLPPLRSVASPPTSPLQPLSNLPPKHAPWSKEEDDLLVSRKDLDVVELSVLLPNRLSQQIRSRLSYLNSDPTLCSPPLGTVTLPPIIPATDVAGVKVQEVPVSVSDTYFPSSFMRSKGSMSAGSSGMGGIGGVAALSAAASLAAVAHSEGSPTAGHRPAPSSVPAFSPPSKRTKLDIPPSTQPKLQAKLITELEKSKSPQTLGSLSNLSSPLSSTSSPGTGMISPAINLPTPITSGSNKPGASTLPNKRLLGLGTPHYFPSPRTSTPKATSGNCYFDK
ncbi:hypothetical protein B0I75DRAFT_18130 [Yarrowia lipolytica]|uniref:YALI0C02629p n=2 Tax=Yarrowia lipolytica TaxID=4952 RepID=Q6CD94_YARLI|nr:YALI0C02629p [Yarrowia lipolytica CLIB122]AOW02248.1 hypothetical protein YALI1_C03674g [Yarrowia lipolytica]KAB8283546.1 hypothetical protein BKA91DRAFT_12230 [Yarrowia lipolytica]KAE8172065.1 hypothetical protein BKA90DRAFT_20615 [Yarrowia lipolytica]KAJ8052985.1 hypothetical protein LXG23DRAFT_49290 [Yarrowia lipolytica]RDW47714.1 hypothetical protein B0I74DRAFT_12720 [Yarrowia lipolytica]|eukprot:XP_501368.1 YALI0C02629p [Yarrowia lipolytica CLIB122]